MTETLHQLTSRKLATTARLMRQEGIVTALWELGMYLAKPLRVARERALWRRLRCKTREGPLLVLGAGSPLEVSRYDQGIARELAAYGFHEPRSCDFIRELLKPGMTVLDIGANIGYFAVMEGNCVGAEGRLIAIEPEPENYALLRRNLERNGLLNAIAYQLAIGSRNGIARLNISSRSNWHTMLECAWVPTNQIDVEERTLDALVTELGLERVDLVRMDIEGYEVVAIDGMLRTLEKYRPLVFVEVHPHIVGPAAIVGFIRKIRDCGYVWATVIDRSRDIQLRAWRIRPERWLLGELENDTRIHWERRPLSIFVGDE